MVEVKKHGVLSALQYSVLVDGKGNHNDRVLAAMSLFATLLQADPGASEGDIWGDDIGDWKIRATYRAKQEN